MYSLPPADERTLTVGLDAIVYNLEEVVIRSERQLSVYRSQIKVHGPCGAWEHPMVELALPRRLNRPLSQSLSVYASNCNRKVLSSQFFQYQWNGAIKSII